MTSKTDFQAALDADLDDWRTRLVFADWLEERGDPRAEGYRALGLLRREPTRWMSPSFPPGYFYERSKASRVSMTWEISLPFDWFAGLPLAARQNRKKPQRNTLSRRQVENAAARAFVKLPAARRAELLGSSH